jgi:hypothetical protein
MTLGEVGRCWKAAEKSGRVDLLGLLGLIGLICKVGLICTVRCEMDSSRGGVGAVASDAANTQLSSYFPRHIRCAVRTGRRVCGQERAKDALSPRAQQRHHFAVGKLPDFSTLSGNPLAEALIDNRKTPPDEQAAFRIDFPAWLSRFDSRRRAILTDMAMATAPTS